MMKRILAMLGGIGTNCGGTRVPVVALLAAGLTVLSGLPAVASMPYTLIPSSGPAVGGNIVTITNLDGSVSDGSDITNVVFSNATQVVFSTNIPSQGTGWVQVVMPAHVPGNVEITIQSTSAGETQLADPQYIFNSFGQIGHAGGWEWLNLGSGINNTVNALLAGPNGTLYAGAGLAFAGVQDSTRVAKWDGASWTNLGSISPGTVIMGLAAGLHGELYAGGTGPGGPNSTSVAMWNGTTWTNLGPGLDGLVRPQFVTTNGVLYVCGEFTNSTSVATNMIATWDGTNWTYIGVQGYDGSINPFVYSLAMGPDGALYAGGYFTNAGGVTASNVAKWNGTSWTNLGSGLDNAVVSLAMGPDGALYAGGYFTDAGGVAANYVAKWNGTSWTNLGSGMDNPVLTLAMGSSGLLYAGGGFTNAGGVAANYVASWNGTSWTNIDVGVDDLVNTLIETNGVLYIGGDFLNAGNEPNTHVACWRFQTPFNGVAPTNGAVAGGYPVTISGRNLCDGTTGDVTRVTLCGVTATVSSVIGATQLVVVAGTASVAGLGDVAVYSTSHGSTIKSNAFAYTQHVADIAVSDFVFLPVNMTTGTSAGTVSFRLANNGPEALDVASVGYDFYMGTNPASMTWFGSTQAMYTLAVSQETLVILTPHARHGLTVPSGLSGVQQVNVVARHLSELIDPNLSNNTATAVGRVRIKTGGVNSIGRQWNDYDGDGKADFAVCQPTLGNWYVLESGIRYSSWGLISSGLANNHTVAGDYDGDGLTDVGFYDSATGVWRIRLTGSGQVVTGQFGGPSFEAVPVDLDGDGKTDPLVFRQSDGAVVALLSAYGYAWSEAQVYGLGNRFVPADYDGDRLADPATYYEATGTWMIWPSASEYPLSLGNFGGLGWQVVSADYDGDGKVDPAVYSADFGIWVMLLSSTLETTGAYTTVWGRYGAVGSIPVPADYDGDGKVDPAVYHAAAGVWQVYPSSQGYVQGSGLHGGIQYTPALER